MVSEKVNVDEEVVNQMEAEEILEDLSDVDLAINDTQEITIYAQERFKLAVNYRSLYIQADAVRVSIKANKAVGNTTVVDDYSSKLEIVERDLKHLLRGIREIDKACPQAIQKMKDMQLGG